MNKLFRTPVLTDGVPLDLPVVAPLRYAHCPAEHAMARFEDRLRDAGVLREAVLGGGPVKAVRMSACLEVGCAALREDLHFFLAGPPAYQDDAVPLI